jgi:hypothetical protein
MTQEMEQLRQIEQQIPHQLPSMLGRGLVHNQQQQQEQQHQQQLMTDSPTRPGQLLLLVDDDNTEGHTVADRIRAEEFGSVRVETSMRDAVRAQDRTVRTSIKFDLFLLTVREGEEQDARDRIESAYRDLRGGEESGERLRFAVCENPILELAVDRTLSVHDFRFSRFHAEYRNILKVKSGSDYAFQPQILLVDSGVASDVAGVKAYSFVASEPSLAVQHWHGTVMASLIRDCLPHTPIISYRVANERGGLSGWDFVLGVGTASAAKVINCSLTFRPTDTSMIGVFHRTIAAVYNDPIAQPVIVAAAGNDGLPTLALPAAFPEAVAIASISSRGSLSAFSAWGGRTRDDSLHPWYFVLPGGETDTRAYEVVGTFGEPQSEDVWGTSCATAYASALITHHWATLGPSSTRNEVLESVLNSVDRSIDNYSYEKHGHGIPTWRVSGPKAAQGIPIAAT